MPGIYTNSQGTELFSYALKRATGVADIYSDITMIAPIYVSKSSVNPVTKRKEISERLLIKGTHLSSISHVYSTETFLFNIDLLRLDEINWLCPRSDIEDIVLVPSSSGIPFYSIGGVVNTYDREESTTYVITSGSQE